MPLCLSRIYFCVCVVVLSCGRPAYQGRIFVVPKICFEFLHKDVSVRTCCCCERGCLHTNLPQPQFVASRGRREDPTVGQESQRFRGDKTILARCLHPLPQNTAYAQHYMLCIHNARVFVVLAVCLGVAEKAHQYSCGRKGTPVFIRVLWCRVDALSSWEDHPPLRREARTAAVTSHNGLN